MDALSVGSIGDESTEEIDISALSFDFRGEPVPVYVSSTVSPAEAQMALECKLFTSWVARCEKEYNHKKIKMHSVELQSVDPFGRRYVLSGSVVFVRRLYLRCVSWG